MRGIEEDLPMPRCLPLVILGLLAVGCSTPKGAGAADRRAYVMRMHDDALAELYARHPDAKARVEAAPGHGVFSNIGTNLIFVSTEGGYGVVVDRATGKRTFMRAAGGGVGIGLGAKDVRLVFVFTTKDAIDAFMSGKWTVGVDADAAAKVDDQGGEQSGTVKTGEVEIYTITRNGLALSATVNGTRFYLDRELNEGTDAAPAPQGHSPAFTGTASAE
jgi:lipid-binding SYLF domain-containing protein